MDLVQPRPQHGILLHGQVEALTETRDHGDIPAGISASAGNRAQRCSFRHAQLVGRALNLGLELIAIGCKNMDTVQKMDLDETKVKPDL